MKSSPCIQPQAQSCTLFVPVVPAAIHQCFLKAASAKGDRTHELRSATRAKSEGERDQ